MPEDFTIIWQVTLKYFPKKREKVINCLLTAIYECLKLIEHIYCAEYIYKILLKGFNMQIFYWFYNLSL